MADSQIQLVLIASEAKRMNEEEWLSCSDPTAMCHYLRESGKLTDRKVRLFGAAFCRHFWPLLTDGRTQRAVVAAEQFADGRISERELAIATEAAEDACRTLRGRRHDDHAAEGAITAIAVAAQMAAAGHPRISIFLWKAALDFAEADVFAHPVSEDEVAQGVAANRAAELSDAMLKRQCDVLHDIYGNPFRSATLDSAWLSWTDGTAVRLATASYEERCMPSGTLDNGRLAVLADALEEAGCHNEEILGHCRSPNGHVRGCWLIDMILDKS